MIEKNRGVFNRKDIMEEYTKYFGVKQNDEHKIDVILPY